MLHQHSMSEDFLKNIHRIIEEKLGDEEFNSEELARCAGISRSSLHRRLKKLIGISASELITRLRIKRAAMLLQDDAETVSEIAYRVGFRDPSYFTKVFKKYYGTPPGKIRSALHKEIDHHEIPAELDTGKDPSRLLWKSSRRKIRSMTGLLLILCAIITIAILLRIDRSTSMAVLPLLNLTGNQENDYYIEGIHDALVGELGQIGLFRVISTTSARHFRNSDALLPEIANLLGVNTIVEGSVKEIGDSLTITIQLIDVFPKERHLYAADYQDAIQNIVGLQRKMARDIARHTRTRIINTPESEADRSSKLDPDTYKSYLRGMFLINQGTEQSIRIGIDTLAGAIRRDPGDPYALSGYALGKAIQGHGSNISREYFRSATVSASRAIAIDKNNAMAHTALALLNLYQYWDWNAAREEFEDALASNPNNEIAHAHYAWYYVLFGNTNEAIYHAHQAVILDPLSATYKSWLAWIYYWGKNYDEAEYWARESIKLSEQIPWGNLVLGWTQLEKGNFQEALEAHEKLPVQALHWKWFLCRTYVLTGQRNKAMALWNEVLNESESNTNPFYMGMMAGVLGFHAQAFSLLKDARDNKYYPVEYIMTFPSAQFIMDRPQYDSLLASMHIPVKSRRLTGSAE